MRGFSGLLRRQRVCIVVYASLILLIAFAYVFRNHIRRVVRTRRLEFAPTVSSVVRQYGPRVESRFAPLCREKRIGWPPARIQMLAFKDERTLEVWGAAADGPYQPIAIYDILAASGKSGPKRRDGDWQVPEGFYQLTTLNPESAYHLSIRVAYPNSEDIEHAIVPRDGMGGDIYVHGSNGSIGCLAMGDAAIEEIFCLTAWADRSHRDILIAPNDFRRKAGLPDASDPWINDLYKRLAKKLKEFPVPTEDAHGS